LDLATFVKYPTALNKKGAKWSLDPAPGAACTVVITDSNGKYFEQRRVPSSIATLCFPGCNIRTVNELLRKTKNIQPTVQRIIVAVGINDQQGTNDANLNSDIQDILRWGQQHQKGVHIAGISASNRLVAQEHNQVAHINKLISDIFEENYVDALPADQIQVDMNDMTGVYHDITTALKVFDELLKVIPPNPE